MNAVRPGPGARAVSRPSIPAVVIWGYMLLIGVACFVAGRIIAVGVFMIALVALGAANMVLTRVWVEGDVLYSRRFGRWSPPLRLDRLRDAELSAFGRNSGRQLVLTDELGTIVQLDAFTFRLKPLYAALADHIRWDTTIANDRLRKKLAKHWPGPPLGPGEP